MRRVAPSYAAGEDLEGELDTVPLYRQNKVCFVYE